MLKLQVEKLDDVDENLRSLYEEKEGKFSLKVDGLEDTGALKRAKEHEKSLRQAAEKSAREEREAREALDKKIEELQGKKHKDNGDIEALEKSWGDKLAKEKAKDAEEISRRDGWLRELTVNSSAQGLAAELAVEGSSKALLPHIQARLAMEMRDGRPVAVVLGLDGKPSALTIEDLKNEFINDAAFAPLIVGTKAAGAGSNGGKGGGATSSVDPSKMTTAEKSAYISKNGLDAWSKLVSGTKT
jgi:hypothetical protein